MVIIACIIVWILCDIAEASAKDRSYYDRQEERRHQELMESEERRRAQWHCEGSRFKSDHLQLYTSLKIVQTWTYIILVVSKILAIRFNH